MWRCYEGEVTDAIRTCLRGWRGDKGVVVQLLSHVRPFVTLWMAVYQASLSFTISQNLLKLTSIELVMPSNHVILCCPLLLLPSVFPSIRVFSNKSVGFSRQVVSFPISPSNEYSGLISFRIDWFDLIAVQGALKNLIQHHSSKASVLWRSSFFMVWLSQLYLTTEKIVALTIWTFVGKVMSLLFNMLSRFVIVFLPRSKRHLILWLQVPSTVILEPKRIKSVTVSMVSPSICREVMGPECHDLSFWILSFKPALSIDWRDKGRIF